MENKKNSRFSSKTLIWLWSIIVLMIIVVIIGWAIHYFSGKNNSDEKIEEGKEIETTIEDEVSVIIKNSEESEKNESDLSEKRLTLTLRKGDENEEVKILQAKLKKLGLYQGEIHGCFSESVYKAVIAFQKQNGLKQDGIVGRNTRAVLNGDPLPTSAPISGGSTKIVVQKEVDKEALKKLEDEVEKLTDEVKKLTEEKEGEPSPTPVALKPSATSLGVELINNNSAILTGKADPNGFQTDVWFQYGLTTSLNKKSDVQSIGNGTLEQDVSIQITGLEPSTKYWYRLYAKSSKGQDIGTLKSFVTTSSGTTSTAEAKASLVDYRIFQVSGKSYIEAFVIVEDLESGLYPEKYWIKFNGNSDGEEDWEGDPNHKNGRSYLKPSSSQVEIQAFVRLSNGEVLQSKIVKYPE
ncbi:MAG: peptidoglycan-binding protein [Candidatus Colwellbacteria bacterium]|nr:peptidoglycan-binding protein [Candidatus Colwellbacteria bacterium]MDD3752622.1 peptidoglycan-binding protein [Candidatus Colwellbacteria bacterium]MDD4818697.1 peptidoglycan-binding protein [Candidatus Colwellbacteria bacterium]